MATLVPGAKLLPFGISLAALANAFVAALGESWRCDDLTPDLCHLRMEAGSVMVRGLRLGYWLYGEEGGATPVVMVHGGPGWSHDYMLPLKQQACRGRRVLFYDQVGAGVSERPREARRTAPWLLTIEYYVEELSALLAHVGWSEYHVVGSSWGTVVSQAFAFSRPAGLRSLVLSGPLSDGQLYIRAQWDPEQGSIGSLPPFVRARIRSLEAAEAYDSPEYQALDNTMTSFFTVRTYPPPDCFMRAAGLQNKEIYVGMQGPSEFTIGGVLAHFNFTGRLAEVDYPVLLTTGRYDTMRPPVVEAMLRALPRAEWHMFPHSGHCSMIDDAGEMNDVVADFLARSDGPGPAVSLWQSAPLRAHRDAWGAPTWSSLCGVLVLGLVVGYAAGRQASSAWGGQVPASGKDAYMHLVG